MTTLQDLNGMAPATFVSTLGAIFEHSPWVAEAVAHSRPFSSVAALHAAMCAAVGQADATAQLHLIRAHPELASKAAIAGKLTAESTREQRGAGLQSLTPQQFTRLLALNGEYVQRFGFPFIVAVKGHSPDSIIALLTKRLAHDAATEQRAALDQIARIARFRLEDLVDEDPGVQILSRADELAGFSDESTGLTCAVLTPAHQQTARLIRDYMLAAGLDAHIDAIGNVVGRLAGSAGATHTLITGSHYDTVSNAGRYDGRLGVLLPISVVERLRRTPQALPFALEIIAFCDEEGLRYKSTFLGSRAVAGNFDASVLESVDANGQSLRAALVSAALDPAQIAGLARDPATTLGFVEVHIEQGPVLLDADEPLGVVTGIAGARRLLVTVRGQAGHAGTVPMGLRRDAAAGAAEIVLRVESVCNASEGLVGTVGELRVPEGAVNVIPGSCELSIDMRSADDVLRKRAVTEVETGIAEIGRRRGLEVEIRSVLDTPATQCAPSLQQALGESVGRVTGRHAPALSSGAGHDAIMMARLAPVGMLFVRCGNGGISHHPDETMTAADAELAVRVFEDFLLNFKVR